MFIAEFDKRNYTLKYVNAGHNLPVMIMDGQVQTLYKGCTILGAFPELKEVEIGTIQINNEALILSFTDGLTDVRNEKGNIFDENFLIQFSQQNEFSSASIFNKLLMEEINRFKGDQDYPDDITVLTCKIFSRKK